MRESPERTPRGPDHSTRSTKRSKDTWWERQGTGSDLRQGPQPLPAVLLTPARPTLAPPGPPAPSSAPHAPVPPLSQLRSPGRSQRLARAATSLGGRRPGVAPGPAPRAVLGWPFCPEDASRPLGAGPSSGPRVDTACRVRPEHSGHTARPSPLAPPGVPLLSRLLLSTPRRGQCHTAGLGLLLHCTSSTEDSAWHVTGAQ